MFVIYNKVTRGSLIMIFLYLHYIYFFVFLVVFFFNLLTIYLILVNTLLLLLQLCLLTLPLQVFLRNQVGQSSKQRIQEAWSTLFITLSDA